MTFGSGQMCDHRSVRLRVEHDEQHDKVLEGGRRDEAPHVVAQALVVLRYVDIHRLRVDHELDAGFLRRWEEARD